MADPNLYYGLVRRPLVTEKTSTLQATRNQYTFEVDPRANKSEIKKAIEALFSVKVTKVNITIVPGKQRRFLGRPGKSRPWKKAIVSLRQGDAIEIA
jgi:large subunit ribosomal protein L23